MYIITDGEENASREFNGNSIANLIARLNDTDKWTFSYLGASPDLVEVAKKLNIPHGNIINYSPTPDGLNIVSSGLYASSTSYFSNRAEGVTSTRTLTGSDNTADWTEADKSS